jgi:hypothetical protein
MQIQSGRTVPLNFGQNAWWCRGNTPSNMAIFMMISRLFYPPSLVYKYPQSVLVKKLNINIMPSVCPIPSIDKYSTRYRYYFLCLVTVPVSTVAGIKLEVEL